MFHNVIFPKQITPYYIKGSFKKHKQGNFSNEIPPKFSTYVPGLLKIL